MFKRQQEAAPSFDKVETLLGKNFEVDGNIKASGSVRIEGYIKGEVEIQGDLVVSESAVIEGIVNASNVYMSGKIIGNLQVDGQLKLTSTAVILGDIVVDKFIMDEGANFQGNCTMSSMESFGEKTELEGEE